MAHTTRAEHCPANTQLHRNALLTQQRSVLDGHACDAIGLDELRIHHHLRRHIGEPRIQRQLAGLGVAQVEPRERTHLRTDPLVRPTQRGQRRDGLEEGARVGDDRAGLGSGAVGGVQVREDLLT
jgi:hypothetical protein